MKPVTIAALFNHAPFFQGMIASMQRLGAVESVLIVAPEAGVKLPGCEVVDGNSFHSSAVLEAVLACTKTAYLLVLPAHAQVLPEDDTVEALLAAAQGADAGMVYADFSEVRSDGKTLHPLNDYLPGSVRDSFGFGPMMLFSVDAARDALARHGSLGTSRFAALYDLRLKVSIDRPIHHVARPLYAVMIGDSDEEVSTLFDYVDPRNAAAQKELEAVFTDYLKKTRVYLSPEQYMEVPRSRIAFPVEASVVIPVRNRTGTIADAVKSAVSQKTDFPFNVLVVDNHSSDGTSEVLSRLAAGDHCVCHLVPARTDLGIGGCWNEALYSDRCGRYAVQLDSDDLYSSTHTLQEIVDMLRTGRFGMVVGSYTLVDFDLNEIAPGLVDHREWTDDNGRNNALRINGLGAPRAFDTALMRDIGFLNVSYGEDYAAALRLCREYRIGRIYESLYLCRRWPGNTDAALSIEEANRNDAFKDTVRTNEIAARRAMNCKE